VALKLREIYPAVDRTSLYNKITLEYMDRLIDKVTEGFKGDAGVVPRQFLRQFLDVMDLAAEHEDFDPMAAVLLMKNRKMTMGMSPWCFKR